MINSDPSPMTIAKSDISCPMNAKQRAAESALEFVQSGNDPRSWHRFHNRLLSHALGAAIKSGTIRDIKGVPTSVHSEHRARTGHPLTTLADHPHPDVTVDGADEVAPTRPDQRPRRALLREKILAQSSKKLSSSPTRKIVTLLGTHSKLPVEVTPSSTRFTKSSSAPSAASPSAQDARGKIM